MSEYSFTVTNANPSTGQRAQFIVRNRGGRRLCTGLVIDGELHVSRGALEVGFADKLAELCGCKQRADPLDPAGFVSGVAAPGVTIPGPGAIVDVDALADTPATPVVQDPPKSKKRRKAKDGRS